jgi:Ig-like domain from next to BRCA1 gene
MHSRISYLIALAIAIFALSNCGGSVNQQATKPAEKIAAEARADAPMPANGFRATITLPEPPTSLQPGQKIQLLVKVKNNSDVSWPAHGRAADGFFQVNLGNNWYDERNVRILNHPYVRSGLPRDLRPGEEAEISLNITAPDKPGQYTLQIDLVQEMVAWFSEKGSTAPKFKVSVRA